MTRLVLDTNVLISGLLFGGAAGRFLERMWTGKFRIAVSPEIEAEYVRVLAYPRFHLDRQDIARLKDSYILPFCDHVPVKVGPAVCRDLHDDKFLYCAVAARASAIVTGDKDILAVGTEFRGIPILTVQQALQAFPG